MLLTSLGDDKIRSTNPHLAHIDPLVPAVDKLDGQGPVVVAWGVAHCEPFVLCEGALASREDMPVSQSDPRNLETNMSV